MNWLLYTKKKERTLDQLFWKSNMLYIEHTNTFKTLNEAYGHIDKIHQMIWFGFFFVFLISSVNTHALWYFKSFDYYPKGVYPHYL